MARMFVGGFYDRLKDVTSRGREPPGTTPNCAASSASAMTSEGQPRGPHSHQPRNPF